MPVGAAAVATVLRRGVASVLQARLARTGAGHVPALCVVKTYACRIHHSAGPARAKFNYFSKSILERLRATASRRGAKRFPHNLMDKIVLMRKPLFLKPLILYPALIISAYLYSRIERVPLTGRRRLKPIPDFLAQPFFSLIDDVILEEMEPELLPETSREHEFVARIIERFKTSHAAFVAKLAEEGKAADMPGCQLSLDNIRFRIVDNGDPNASCSGGGLVLVHRSLLELFDYDPDQVAIVIGHEIGHYVAQHTAESIGHSFLAYTLNTVVSLLLGKDHASPYLKAMIDVFYMLPKSRGCEMEADYIGLIMSARACFDITQAGDVWMGIVKYEAVMRASQEGRLPTHEDLEAVLQGDVVSETFSTHPMFKARIAMYDPRGEWMKIARGVQLAHCGGATLSGAGADATPLMSWLRAVRPSSAKHSTAHETPQQTPINGA